MIVEPKYKFDKITMPKIKEPLSEQEINVLKLAAIGLGNTEIAKCLYISPHTVKAHLKSVYIKMGVSNRTSAVFYYFCDNKNNPFVKNY